MAIAYIAYIGDFDLRNENVQAHLVRNNAQILNKLGYRVVFIGLNRRIAEFSCIEKLPKLDVLNRKDNSYSDKFVGDGIESNIYFELPYTFSIKGIIDYRNVRRLIIQSLDNLKKSGEIKHVITYQAPTFAPILMKILKWCKNNAASYIVNCADIPIFDSQPIFRRIVMNLNWAYMHRVNKDNADGIIAVSNFINRFYHKDGRPSVIIPPLFNERGLENVQEIEVNSTIIEKYAEITESTMVNDIPIFLYAGMPFIINSGEVNPKGMKDRLDKVIDLMIELEKFGIRFRFDIIGITMEDYYRSVPRHSGLLSQSMCIRFLGRKSHRETLARLTEADFMINYRDKNKMTLAGLSTKVVESVSLGTPVIINDIGDTFLYLQEGVTGFVLNDSTYDNFKLISGLCKLSNNERYFLKKKCRESKVFSIESYTDKFFKFIKEIESKYY